MTRALIIVDVQNDFCEGGSLAVVGGAAVAAGISRYLAEHAADFQVVAATQDWHIDPGSHFSEAPDYVESWPVHCVAGSRGAAFHPDLETDTVQAVFRKGRWEAAYSGFEGFLAAPEVPSEPDAEPPVEPGPDEQPTGPMLDSWLREQGVDEVYVAGLATDHCVRATALDAVRAGFATTVLLDLTAGVSPGSTTAAVAEMADAGVTIRDA